MKAVFVFSQQEANSQKQLGEVPTFIEGVQFTKMNIIQDNEDYETKNDEVVVKTVIDVFGGNLRINVESIFVAPMQSISAETKIPIDFNFPDL